MASDEWIVGPTIDNRGLGPQPERRAPEVIVEGAPQVPEVVIQEPATEGRKADD